MDEQRIFSKIAQLQHYMGELKEIIPESEVFYCNLLKDRRATERVL